MPGDIILLYIHVYHKWRSYDIWFLKYKVRQTKIFDILSHFLPFQPLDNLDNQNLNIEKNNWRYYHFIHLHHKWQSHTFLSFWTLFCPFTPYGPRKSKLKKKAKNTRRYYHFTNITDTHVIHGSSDMECTDRIFCHFGLFFCPFTPLTTQNSKFWKYEKIVWRYHFTQV